VRTVAVYRRQLQALENAEFERLELRRNVNECIGASVCFGRVPIGRHEDPALTRMQRELMHRRMAERCF
jgi:hypothetical protein